MFYYDIRYEGRVYATRYAKKAAYTVARSVAQEAASSKRHMVAVYRRTSEQQKRGQLIYHCYWDEAKGRVIGRDE